MATTRTSANTKRYFRIKDRIKSLVFEGIRHKETHAQFLERWRAVYAHEDYVKLGKSYYTAQLNDFFQGMMTTLQALTAWYHCLDGEIIDPFSPEGRKRISEIPDFYKRLETEGSSNHRWIADPTRIFS